MTANLALLAVGFVLTTVVGGGLTYVFQRMAWRHQHHVQQEDLRREQAMRTFEEISRLLDQRLYRMRQVYWAAKAVAKGRDERHRLDDTLVDYRVVLRNWNDNLNRVRALVHTYFGDEARQLLERSLYEEYAAVGEELDEFVREVSACEQVEVRPIGRRLNRLGQSVYVFNVHTLARVQDPSATGLPLDFGKSKLIRFGDQGEQVRRLQRALGVLIDGHFGRDTEKALRVFQTKSGLRVDGIAGPDTLGALDER